MTNDAIMYDVDSVIKHLYFTVWNGLFKDDSLITRIYNHCRIVSK